MTKEDMARLAVMASVLEKNWFDLTEEQQHVHHIMWGRANFYSEIGYEVDKMLGFTGTVLLRRDEKSLKRARII